MWFPLIFGFDAKLKIGPLYLFYALNPDTPQKVAIWTLTFIGNWKASFTWEREGGVVIKGIKIVLEIKLLLFFLIKWY